MWQETVSHLSFALCEPHGFFSGPICFIHPGMSSCSSQRYLRSVLGIWRSKHIIQTYTARPVSHCLLVYWDMVSLCNPGCPGLGYIVLEPTENQLATACAYTTTPGSLYSLKTCPVLGSVIGRRFQAVYWYFRVLSPCGSEPCGRYVVSEASLSADDWPELLGIPSNS